MGESKPKTLQIRFDVPKDMHTVYVNRAGLLTNVDENVIRIFFFEATDPFEDGDEAYARCVARIAMSPYSLHQFLELAGTALEELESAKDNDGQQSPQDSSKLE